MRPGVLKQALVVVGCGALAVTASACESTEDESARIGRQAGAAEVASTLKIGATNRAIHASDVTTLSGGGRKAIAVKLTVSSSRAQREVPLLVEAKDKSGKVVYSNATGAEPLLQRVTLLPAHKTIWWVDDQVLTSQAVSTAKVTVGTGKPAKGGTRAAALSAVAMVKQTESGSLSGELTNHTGKAQEGVPVFAVALRGGKVVAAGRSVVASLPVHSSTPATFNIPLVGNAAGAKIELTALPGPTSHASSGALK